MSADGAEDRFWLALRALYQAAGQPTLKELVRLGRDQSPAINIGHSTVNGWLNHKTVPLGPKNERYFTAMIGYLQARVTSSAQYEGPAPAEWAPLLRAAQAQRAAGQKAGRPRRPDGPSDGLGAPGRSARPALAGGRARPGRVAARDALFGRDSELARLSGLVRGIAAERGGVAFVEGEPGIGKSTLVRAALTDAASLGCQVFWGTGGELDQALPLQPLLDALRVRDRSANPRRKAIARFLRGEVSTDRGLDGPALLAEQLLALVSDECAARPAILVIDDLQWADQATVGLLARLAGRARQLPLLLIGMMRPVPQRDDLLALRRAAGGAVRLPLAALAPDDAAELVGCLAGGSPDGQLLRLADDAAGNPLYITELISALKRSSRMTITDGVATLTAGPAPRSLAAAIADRLGFLSEPAREVLRSASLLGPEFPVADLAILLGRGVSELAPVLNEACVAGVLTESGRHLRFRHPLIHAALYEALPAPVRTAWHREAGRALATASAPPDRVARQLLWATSEPDGSPEPMDEWMLDWLAGAAELLVAQAPQVAVRLLDQAVACLPAASARRCWLAGQLADALYRSGDKAAAAAVASRELSRATDPDLVVSLHWTLAQYRMGAGLYAESLATLGQALEVPGLTVRHRSRLLVLTARTHNVSGELETGGRIARAALAAAEEANDRWAMGWALHTMAGAALSQGQGADSLLLFDRGLAVTRGEASLTDLRLLLQINKTAALTNLDRIEEALTLAVQARELAREAGAAIRLTQAHSVLGQLLFEVGRWDDALAELRAMPQSLEGHVAVCVELGIAAQVSLHRGDVPAARGFLTAVEPHAARIGRLLLPPLPLAVSLDHEQAGDLPAALSALTRWLGGGDEEALQVQDILPDAARLAVRVGDLAAARAIAAQATALAATGEAPSVLGTALYCRGMLGQDASLLLAAAERFEQASRPLLRARALEGAASALAGAGHGDRAQVTLAKARELYTALGAWVDVARTRAAPATAAPV